MIPPQQEGSMIADFFPPRLEGRDLQSFERKTSHLEPKLPTDFPISHLNPAWLTSTPSCPLTSPSSHLTPT